MLGERGAEEPMVRVRVVEGFVGAQYAGLPTPLFQPAPVPLPRDVAPAPSRERNVLGG